MLNSGLAGVVALSGYEHQALIAVLLTHRTSPTLTLQRTIGRLRLGLRLFGSTLDVLFCEKGLMETTQRNTISFLFVLLGGWVESVQPQVTKIEHRGLFLKGFHRFIVAMKCLLTADDRDDIEEVRDLDEKAAHGDSRLHEHNVVPSTSSRPRLCDADSPWLRSLNHGFVTYVVMCDRSPELRANTLHRADEVRQPIRA